MDREELKARTKQFALRVMKMTDALPGNAKGKVIANQVLRSATAVASGYRAACRARSKADWVDKIGRALEEADESLLWLELTQESGLVPPRRIAALKQEAAELTAVFAAIHKSSKSWIRSHKSWMQSQPPVSNPGYSVMPPSTKMLAPWM